MRKNWRMVNGYQTLVSLWCTEEADGGVGGSFLKKRNTSTDTMPPATPIPMMNLGMSSCLRSEGPGVFVNTQAKEGVGVTQCEKREIGRERNTNGSKSALYDNKRVTAQVSGPHTGS